MIFFSQPRLWLLTFLIAGILVSCSKKPTPPQPSQPSLTGKLAKIAYQPDTYDSIYYNDAGNIARIRSVYDRSTGLLADYFFEYNAQQQLQRIHDNRGDEYRYEYLNGKPVVVSHYAAGIKNDYKVYDYEQGRLVKIGIHLNTDGLGQQFRFEGQQEFEYYADGNLKSEASYDVDQTTLQFIKKVGVVYSEYDNGRNLDETFYGKPYLYQIVRAQNNARRRIVTLYHSGRTVEYQFQFQYNNSNNPIYRKISYMDQGDLVEAEARYYYY